MFHLFGREEIYRAEECPACIWVARECGKVVVVRHKKLCKDHRANLLRLMDAPDADMDLLLYWSNYLQPRRTFGGNLTGHDGK